ncbi:sugar ABC transporter substrate-binding protein [Nonomuraea lactucae]|uniref:sugar ABC transporter substrate-binding protein n=1 Tax=Nonomuraea lactucae TaxID=2249762 RepID=UPI000DE343F7|nr:sugar ABC transporter substrate-binding protein [Nonomuraea lactucae]
MKFRRIAVRATLPALMVMAAACGGSPGKDSDNGSDKGAGKTYSIGIVQFASSDETSETAIKAYVEYAQKQGWEVSKVDPQGSVDKAISAMNDYVQKRVDAIVATVFPSDSLTAGVRAATAAGIPVISFAGGTAAGVPINMDGGRPNAAEGAKLLVKDLGSTGNLLVLGYKSGLPCLGREEQLMDTVKGTGIQVTRNEVPIPGQVEAATRFTQAWLAKHPAGSGPLAVWGCFDDPALGAVSALRQAGRDDVRVYGINGTPAALRAVKAGDLRATAFVDVAAIGLAIAQRTPAIIAAGPDAKPEDVAIPTFLVTTENYDEFVKKYPAAK